MLAINDFIKDKKALVVEDDLAISQLLKLNLINLGFSVDVFNSADAAQSSVTANKYSLCLLDWMLPGTQGIDFLKKNRSKLGSTKVMMVTARVDSDSIVNGLETGADDYLTKPFDAAVLAARVRQLMRRLHLEEELKSKSGVAAKDESSVLGFDGLSVDTEKHDVRLNGEEVHLTPSEFKLIAELLKAGGKVLTRDNLIDMIQGQDVNVTGRTIDTHIFTLRKKIGTWAQHVETIRGVGYRILISLQDKSEPEIL
ncbi:MAG: DNA-binding response regulator PhoB [Pseudobdellovibrio sp.]|jgi:two-component system phosphate regulon response regulator PhoB|nr:DNA-binding response regulator PhoB [Pseudobdellovibrio sp.]